MLSPRGAPDRCVAVAVNGDASGPGRAGDRVKRDAPVDARSLPRRRSARGVGRGERVSRAIDRDAERDSPARDAVQATGIVEVGVGPRARISGGVGRGFDFAGGTHDHAQLARWAGHSQARWRLFELRRTGEAGWPDRPARWPAAGIGRRDAVAEVVGAQAKRGQARDPRDRGRAGLPVPARIRGGVNRVLVPRATAPGRVCRDEHASLCRPDAQGRGWTRKDIDVAGRRRLPRAGALTRVPAREQGARTARHAELRGRTRDRGQRVGPCDLKPPPGRALRGRSRRRDGAAGVIDRHAKRRARAGDPIERLRVVIWDQPPSR